MLERMIFENRNVLSAETAETENSGKAVVQLFCSALHCSESPKNRRSIPGFPPPLQIRFPPLLSVSPLVFFFSLSLFLFACVLFIVFFFSALNRKVLSHYYRKRAPKKQNKKQVDCLVFSVHEENIKQSRNYVCKECYQFAEIRLA